MKLGTIILSVEEVTPAVAKRWLGQNDVNRRLRHLKAAEYARDMLSGAWHIKPVAICFDQQGKLGNGQHTLTAIVDSGTTQTLLIARNCTRDQIAVMDLGLKRTISDISLFVGREVTSRQAAIAKVLVWGPGQIPSKSFAEIWDAYSQHKDVIDTALKGAPKRAGFSAPVLAACARALYTQDHQRIMRFLEIIDTGMVEGPHESAAIRLRDYCMSMRSTASADARVQTFEKANAALENFLRGQPMSKLYGTSKCPFEIPHTARAEEAAEA